MIAVAAVCVFATAACDRRGGVSERDPAPNSVVETTTQPEPEQPQEPAAVVDQTAPDLDSVDQVLVEIERDLASVDAAPPDAD
jgi:hypothetical protein